MKNTIILFLFILSVKSFGQSDASTSGRHLGGMQFGGQALVGIQYEYQFIKRQYFMLGATIGLGMNDFSDSEKGVPPIYAIQTGLTNLIGKRPWYIEAGIIPTTYFFRQTTYVNINGWLGIKLLNPKKADGIYVGAGWTPKLYSTYNGEHYNNIVVGVKVGVNF